MKQKLINWGAGILIVSALIGFIYNSVESHSADQRFRKIIESQLELQNHKADSLIERQKLYEDAIDRLRYSINENQMIVREVEKEKVKIYNNYITQVSEYRPDSTIYPAFTRDSIDFWKKNYSGFFSKP